METSYVVSRDGTRIAYDRAGEGAPLVLLHGGFIEDRSAWHSGGYVERLQSRFSVLSIDQRGHGDSERPRGVEHYRADALLDDVHAVLDAEGIGRAAGWGYSLGASVALQMARVSSRISAAVVGGGVIGRWLSEEMARSWIAGAEALFAAKAAGSLDEGALPLDARDIVRKADLDVIRGLFGAIASWPIVEPEALRCPTLMYFGSRNQLATAAHRVYEARLEAASVRMHILDGLDHRGEFESIDRVLPVCVDFLDHRASPES